MGKVGNLIIRKRESGRYEYKFEIDPIDGKRQWISKGGFVRKKEAVAEGNRVRDEYVRTNGKPLRKQDNISVNTLADLYLHHFTTF